ncbi:MAG: FAD-dependent monooxygenase [Pseudomonadota bacterium]
MTEIETDILVAGGGIAGLAATARLAAEGFRTLCVDPRPQMPDSDDRRTTAFLMPAVATFEAAGAWAGMAAGATPLNTMRIVSSEGGARGVPGRPRSVTDFNAAEIGDRPFGYNVANAEARRALLGAIATTEGAEVIEGVAVARVLRQSSGAVATLSDGRRIAAPLVVAADGRDSRLRRAAGISARRWQYGQRALVFTVTHDQPHENVSTEIHRPGGPLTLVPMPDHDGRPCSSVVWLNDAALSTTLAALDDEALAARLRADTMDLFGPFEILGPRAHWPIIGQLAMRLVARRLALVGETAHVIPPTGAQGANMSLADIDALTRVLAEARRRGQDIGDPSVLAGYQRARWPETAARVGGIDVLNRFVDTPFAPAAALRREVLATVGRIGPLRQAVMRLGLRAG